MIDFVFCKGDPEEGDNLDQNKIMRAINTIEDIAREKKGERKCYSAKKHTAKS